VGGADGRWLIYKIIIIKKKFEYFFMEILAPPTSVAWFDFDTYPSTDISIVIGAIGKSGAGEAVVYRKLNSIVSSFYVLFFKDTAQVQ